MLVFFLIYDLDNGRMVNVHKLRYKGNRTDIWRSISKEYWVHNREIEVRIFDDYKQIYRNNSYCFPEIADYVQFCYEKYGYKEFFEN